MASFPGQSIAPSRRWDGLIFIVIVLVALVLRGWDFFLLGLDHYDEGVYAISGFWSLQHSIGSALFPYQKFFSPPGYFGLVGVAYRLFGGASDVAAIAINILFGTANVVLAGWIGKRWFGRGCGVAVAALVALSDFNIVFARTALTDTVFVFLFLLSLAFIAISLEKNSLVWALLAGLAAGANWNVKYDGWLSVAVVLAVILASAILGQRNRVELRNMFCLWAVMAAIALGLFLPWLAYTQMRLGGYWGVELFHKQFYTFQWTKNFWQQAANLSYFDGVLSCISPLVAFLAVVAVQGRRFWARWRFICLVSVALTISGFVLGGAGTCAGLALLGLYFSWRRGGMLGPLLVLGILILFVLLPCYTPYARLLLPWIVMVQVVAGVGVDSLLSAAEMLSVPREHGFGNNRQLTWSLGLLSLVVLPATSARFSFAKVDPWNSPPKDGMRLAVTKMINLVPPGSVVFVEEEPAAGFYFRRAGYTTFCTIWRFETSKIPMTFSYSTAAPVYLVAGVYAQLTPTWGAMSPEIRSRLKPVVRFVIQPGDVRLLDDFPPSVARKYRSQPDDRYDLLLFQVMPAAAGTPQSGVPGNRPSGGS